MKFTLAATYRPINDQQRASSKLLQGLVNGVHHQTLLGVTGSGKTFTMANVIAGAGRPALVISHNKTLAWQLYREFKEFFPHNEVHYFVSYYDYYQPEAYLPSTDTYIEKDSKINETIDKLRHAATQAILTHRDTIVVASVSCIYNIGDPEIYKESAVTIHRGEVTTRQEFLRVLVRLKFERNDYAKLPGTFSAKGEKVTVYLPSGEVHLDCMFSGNKIETIKHSRAGSMESFLLFPAKLFVTREEHMGQALKNIEAELNEQLETFSRTGKILEAARLEQRTHYDIEMLREIGTCSGIENYSRHLAFRTPGDPPFTLFDYFGLQDSRFLVFVDESHMTIPQIRGMYHGDRSRKEVLVEHGFRLPSALDNRPLTFVEWEKQVPQAIFVSATPRHYQY